MLNFHLFRIKLIQSNQTTIFDENKSIAEVIESIIRCKPSAELRRGFFWHIGNIMDLKEDGLYFALGRTTKSIVELYDEKEGNFKVEDFESSPYTHVILELKHQLLAIAKKQQLAPTPKGLAKQLEKLLNSRKNNIILRNRIEISEINDPEDFIQHIRNAFAVTRFAMEFGEPNPWDVNEDFQKPMQKLLQKTSGKNGKTSINGEDLNREILEELARATATAGNDAQVIIKTTESKKGVVKHLTGNPAIVTEEEITKDEQKMNLLKKIREYYLKIRKLLGTNK